jgi:ABC-type phosphate transport system substrate-binding protein
MSRGELARLFMKKQIEWSNGMAVAPVDQSTVSMVRAAFTQDVHEQKTSAIAAYWQKQIFSGRGVPPTIRDSDSEVLAFVGATPGAIGYVAAGVPTEGVKTIALD